MNKVPTLPRRNIRDGARYCVYTHLFSATAMSFVSTIIPTLITNFAAVRYVSSLPLYDTGVDLVQYIADNPEG